MSKLDRLRSISFDELRVRAMQAASAFAERHSWSKLAKLPGDESFFRLLDRTTTVESATELLKHFRTRTHPHFLAAFADPAGTVAELRARWPGAESEIVAQANRVVEGKFDLLGLKDLHFGDPIDWHLEPVARKRVPLRHWSRLNYLDAEVAGDKKIIWELNRHQYFAKLGQAYWLTGHERYAETFVAALNSWMDQNPPNLGINWASSLEVAFRSISWLWAFHFFKDSPALNENVFLRALKFLYLHARHLETYLSTYFSPNTHLTGEALGLFYLGTLLPEFRAAARWRTTGSGILLEQLPRHVKTDGVYFEQSSYYHRYTTDFYAHFLILSRLNEQLLPSRVEEKLQGLLDHLTCITRPDGTTPFFGDDDGGRLVTLERRGANDFRAALSTGAVLLGRSDYKQVAREVAEETLWLLGAEALTRFDQLTTEPPARQSSAFADGGYFVMRDGWTPESNYLLIDCGPHGMNNCGHAHADALSFELAARGKTMLVDPGTYTYTGSKDLRDWFRSSSAHNTLTVDGESSSVSAGPFSWRTIARCQTTRWISRARFDYFEGEHDGYLRLNPPVEHSRGILFLKDDYWVMRDRVKSEGAHRYDMWFHFDSYRAPQIQTNISAGGVSDIVSTQGLDVASFAKNGSWREEEAWVSPCYGERKAAAVCVFSATADSADLVTFLLPATESQPRKARKIEAIGGCAFEVHSVSGQDIVMIGSGQRVETARLASDFEWTWARFASEEASVPEELVLIGGQVLELQGKEVLRSGRRINYLLASRAGDQFRIETDDGVLELSLPIHDFESAFANHQSAISNRQ